jgi:hypothetical protein
MPAPTPAPAPQQDYSWLLILVIAYLLLQGGGGAAPIPDPGLHVMLVYDATKSRDLDPKQLSALSSNRVPDYVVTKQGKFARFDISVEQKNMDAVWVEAMKRKRDSLPWVVVSNAPRRGGVEQPLPKTDDEFLSLVKKYAE